VDLRIGESFLLVDREDAKHSAVTLPVRLADFPAKFLPTFVQYSAVSCRSG
jgi:hypothetical protein